MIGCGACAFSEFHPKQLPSPLHGEGDEPAMYICMLSGEVLDAEPTDRAMAIGGFLCNDFVPKGTATLCSQCGAPSYGKELCGLCQQELECWWRECG